MNAYGTEEVATSCPYCGEAISIIVDLSAAAPERGEHYIEDCEVCCRPIQFLVQLDGSGAVQLTAQHENEC